MSAQDYFQWTEDLFDPDNAFFKPEALKGVRVLELCTRVFGPVTADLLADFGAEVIKIELPGVGDLMRYVAPRGFFWQNISPAFTHMNHNKLHVAIDIRRPEGGDLLKRLVARSDVLIENFRPGTMDRWGVGYRQLSEVNPRLVYQANSGFGQWSAYKDRPSYDATSQAMSGFSAITGFQGRTPSRSGSGSATTRGRSSRPSASWEPFTSASGPGRGSSSTSLRAKASSGASTGPGCTFT